MGSPAFLPAPDWIPPPPLGYIGQPADDPIESVRRLFEVIAFTPQYNVTGQPAMSVPVHWNSAGLPIGVQLVGAYGRDDLLLRVAAQLEVAEPWSGRRPVVGA